MAVLSPEGGRFVGPGGESVELWRAEGMLVLEQELDTYLAEHDVPKERFEGAPPETRSLARSELDLLQSHRGFAPSMIFRYDEDYSQYVPRGHYTRSEALKRYFKAMMWLGRMTFLLNGGEPHGPLAPDYLVSAEEAEMQRAAAAFLAEALRSGRVGSKPAIEVWERIYDITAFFSGFGDDLTLVDLIEARGPLGKGTSIVRAVREEKLLAGLKAELAKRKKPAIYSGTGQSWILDPKALRGEPAPETYDRLLGKTGGFRFMGQRFQPDAYVMARLGWPTVGEYVGHREHPFTLDRKRQQKRFLPWSLDVASALGSKRARQISDEWEESAYLGYEEELESLTARFDSLDVKDWNRNLYWSWLYSLRPLLAEFGTGYQTYMRTPVWQDEKLCTAMASWAELRHDTILYAKQPYMPAMGLGPMDRQRAEPGYVEAVPELYARLLATTRFAGEFLMRHDLLETAGRATLERTGDVFETLLGISLKELRDEFLTEEDNRFIRTFAQGLRDALVARRDIEAQKTTLVADVFTDQNNGLVVEEATGQLGLLVVVNMLSDGTLAASAGPVFTYYEFKQPLEDRLTDEAWRRMIASDVREDLMPEWTASYMEGRH